MLAYQGQTAKPKELLVNRSLNSIDEEMEYDSFLLFQSTLLPEMVTLNGFIFEE